MKTVSKSLLNLISNITPMLKELDEKTVNEVAIKGTWTPKQILGHLIDSACNNHQKFVRAANQQPLDFVGYEQDQWVSTQKYNSYDWEELVDFWASYNKHIAHVIAYMPAEVLENEIKIEGVGPFTLGFIMSDYVEHQIHHLKVILPGAGLVSSFQNIYKA